MRDEWQGLLEEVTALVTAHIEEEVGERIRTHAPLDKPGNWGVEAFGMAPRQISPRSRP